MDEPDALLPTLDNAAVAELAGFDQWVTWKLVERTNGQGEKKLTKPPFNPRAGHEAKVNARHTWSPYQLCLDACRTDVQWAGVGFVFSRDDDYFGCDLDACVDPVSLEIDKWALDIVLRLNSYTEITPSGRGLHIIGRGEIRGSRRRRIQLGNGRGFEIYDKERFFTVTGNWVTGTPKDIKPRQAAVESLVRYIFESGEVKPAPRVSKANGAAPPEPSRVVDGTAPPSAGATPTKAGEDSLTQLVTVLQPHCLADATPNLDKLEILTSNSDVAKDTWDHTRKDKESQGWSPSEYDLALANFFMAAGWSDVEIMQGLIAHRRKWGLDLKLRADYYARTILRARQNRLIDEAQEAISPDTLERLLPDQKRAQVLESFATIYGFKFEDVIKYRGDPSKYAVKTERGTLGGEIDLLMSQTAFRKQMAEACAIVVNRVKDRAWDRRAQALLSIARLETIGAEATEAGQARAWVGEYLMHAKPQPFSDDAVVQGASYVRDGRTFIVGDAFATYLMRNLGIRISSVQRGTMLRKAKLESDVVNIRLPDGAKTSRSVWMLPEGWND